MGEIAETTRMSYSSGIAEPTRLGKTVMKVAIAHGFAYLRRMGKEAQKMPTLDWSQCPAVESIPGKVSGAWVFRDTRLPVATVIENLEDLSVDEVVEQFDVTREQVTAVLEFVAESLRASAVPAGARPL